MYCHIFFKILFKMHKQEKIDKYKLREVQRNLKLKDR